MRSISMDGEVLLESYYFTYSLRGEVLTEERRNSQGQTVSLVVRELDGHGNCTKETNLLGDTIRREFDENDNCIKEVGPRASFSKEFSYDDMNRCTKEIISYLDETYVFHHAYNYLNQRVRTTDDLGQETNTTFDRYGRPLEIRMPNGEVIKKSSDPNPP